MAINKIKNGDSGSVVRGILNLMIDAINAVTGNLSGVSTKVSTIETNLVNYTISPEDKTKIANAVTAETLNTELEKKVDKVPGARLITNTEVIKLGNAVDTPALTEAINQCVKLDTKEISLVDNTIPLSSLMVRVRSEDKGKEQEMKIPITEIVSKSMVHTLNDDVTSAEIVHNLDVEYPNVKFIDSMGVLVVVSVQYLGQGRVLVSWNEKKRGKIILSR